ncbi:MAG: hypothetical protein INR69_03515 [Mucilaginibacter polytrichastri]|nr:hypothetical protein [Mucilaginibacter polytrichastri]
MNKATIRLVYKKDISFKDEGLFEKCVMHDTYQRFRQEAEAYDPGGIYNTFSEIKKNEPMAANMSVLLAEAAAVHIGNLNGKMPDISDNNGEGITFEGVRFELNESHIAQKNMHKLSVYFTSGKLYLHESIGNFLILSYVDAVDENSREAFILKLNDALTVSEYIHADTKRPVVILSERLS